LSRKLGVDDDLGVGEIGNGVERQSPQRPHSADHRESGGDQHQHQIPGRPGNETGDHRLVSFMGGAVSALSALLRLLSASIRKLPSTTTLSPSWMPSRTSTYSAPRRPSLTSRGSNRPSPRSTITTCRLPLSMTELFGTATTAWSEPVAISTSAYMSGS